MVTMLFLLQLPPNRHHLAQGLAMAVYNDLAERELGVVTNTCNPSTWEAEARALLQIQVQPGYKEPAGKMLP